MKEIKIEPIDRKDRSTYDAKREWYGPVKTFDCPHCGGPEIGEFTFYALHKAVSITYKCTDCGNQFRVKVGDN